MRYLLIYTEYCTPCLRWFATKKEALKFVSSFNKEHKGNPDYWVDFLLKDALLFKTYPAFEGYRVYSGDVERRREEK